MSVFKKYWRKFKRGAWALGVGALGLLYLLLDIRTKQRNQERVDRLSAEAALAAHNARREKERAVDRARAEAEAQNEQERSKHEKDDDGLPTGPIGNHSRLRK